MDITKGMRAFVAVVETRSFTAAGQRLKISNKLVSKYIAQLETQVGVNLLRRTTRSLSLTEDGRTYLSGVRKVLKELDALDASMTPSTGLKGVLRIAAPLGYGETIVPAAAIAFMDAHPSVRVVIEVEDRYVNLAEEGYDMAIRFGNLKDSSLIARKIGDTQMAAVAAPAYLEKHGEPQHPNELANPAKAYSCIRDENHPDSDHWYFKRGGITLQIPISWRYSANSVMACLAPTLAARGIAMLPRDFMAKELRDGSLVRILTDFETNVLPIHAMQLPTSIERPKNREFIRFLKDQQNLSKQKSAL